MDKDTKAREVRRAALFSSASKSPHPSTYELVKHLARMAAENDYKTLTDMSNGRYTGSRTKGLNHD